MNDYQQATVVATTFFVALAVILGVMASVSPIGIALFVGIMILTQIYLAIRTK